MQQRRGSRVGADVAARGVDACLLPVVEIRGQEDPDEFLLVHGHYDSWYVGIGDNATGDAALLELARVLWGLRDRLKRSVRIAWWPGHSTGRYAGSTWYADTFADEIDEWCIAQLNIDSPGCAGATGVRRSDVDGGGGRDSVRDVDPRCRRRRRARVRPLRAGDYSFNQIGPTGLLHAALEHPDRGAAARAATTPSAAAAATSPGTRPTTCCQWPTWRSCGAICAVYLTTIVRIVNAPLYPFDYAAAVDEIAAAVAEYQRGGRR